MERYLERFPSNSSLNAKRPAEDDLSEDWNSPKRYAKHQSHRPNSKVGLQNKFKDLPVDTESETESQSSNAVKPVRKTTHIPPIILDVQKEWTHQNIKDIVSKHANRYHMQYRNGSKVAIMCHTTEEHQALKEGLRKDEVSFVTYTRKDEKTPKVVIKGLPNTLESELSAELCKIGYPTNLVTKLKSKNGSSQHCPPFLIQLATGVDIVKFRQTKYLFNCVITIEKFKPNRLQGTQCFRCQRFGHSSQNCNLPARCVKCTSSHPSADCPKKDRSTPARCCNCQGEHPANYTNCSARVAYLERLQKKKETQHRFPLTVPTILRQTAKMKSTKTWAAVAKPASSTSTSFVHMRPTPPNTSDPTPLSSNDNPTSMTSTSPPGAVDAVTKEMLNILLAIKKLKSQFITCQSQLEKVTLILTHLGSYV